RDFVAGAFALIIMCVGAMVAACTGNVQSMLLMSGRSGWAALNKVLVLALSLTLLITLVPPLGVLGGAIAFTAVTSLDAVLAAIQVRIGVKVRQGVGPILLALITAGFAAAVPLLISWAFVGETVTGLLVGVVAAAVVWFALIRGMRHQFGLDEVSHLARARQRGSQ